MKSSKRALEPQDRVAEVLFGLIMVLTFTGSLSVATADRAEVRFMLIGALGCNLAWGIIDGVLYLMGCLADKSRSLKTYRAVRLATDPRHAAQLIADALPPLLAAVIQPAEFATLHERLKQLPEPADPAKLTKSDWLGALAVFLLVFLSTLPVALPFVFIQQPHHAMRISNLIAVLMLFLVGVAYGRCVGRSPWGFGVGMVALGLVLVALTMALGG
ncbi:MAG: VIT1/CCC1 transporter family protein [Verrucomicrobiota bacterium]